jgi:ankyrin repeat protein
MEEDFDNSEVNFQNSKLQFVTDEERSLSPLKTVLTTFKRAKSQRDKAWRHSLYKRGSVNIDDTESARSELWKAAKEGNVDRVEELIKLRVDPNFLTDEGTPLTVSVRACRLSMISVILQSPDVDVNIKDRGGIAPVIWASKIDYNPGNPIQQSSSNTIAKLIISTTGADINVCDSNGNTALMYCALLGNVVMAGMLLETRANVNQVNTMGISALHNAASANNLEMTLLLLKNGANRLLKSSDGSTPIDFTRNENIMHLLRGKKTSFFTSF